MRASHDKHRDIARSILPATRRGAARARSELAIAKRRHRRSVRRDLRGLIGAGDDDLGGALADDLGGVDLTRTADIEINQLRRDRRSADKLNHFIRWSVAATADLPVEDRLGHLRGVLPAGLIGDHAVSHLEWVPEIVPRPVGRRAVVSEAEYRARDVRRIEHQRAGLAAGLRAAVATPGGHAAINRALREAEHDAAAATAGRAPGDRVVPGRRFLGLHDVDPFVRELIGDPVWGWSWSPARAATGARPVPVARRAAVEAALDRIAPTWRP